MAEKEKNGFLIYTDYIEQFEMLDRGQLGDLLMALMNTALDKELPEMDDITKVVYLFISQNIGRSNENFDKIRKARSEAGKKGMESRWHNKTDNKIITNDNKNNPVIEGDNNKNSSDNKNNLRDYNETITNNETIKENKQKKSYFEDPLLNDAFEDYVDMRKKIKSPMTDRASELAKKNLMELSGGDISRAIAIVNQSIMNSWKGLFPLKEPQGSSPPAKPKLKNRFNDFEQRQYDMEEFEKRLNGNVG